MLMDKNLDPESYYFITDYYSTRILEIIKQNISKNPNSCYILIEIKNFNNLLFLNGNDATYSMMNLLGKSLQRDDLAIEIINHNHYLCIVNKSNNKVSIPNIAHELFIKIHEFGFNQSVSGFYFHPVIGYYCTNSSNPSAQQIINNCIITLDHAKNNNETICGFDKVLEAKAALSKEIHNANFVHKSLHFKNYLLAYQPVVGSKDGHIHYYECLLRLKDDEGNIKSVGPYISTAEKYGFINLLDNISMEMTIDALYKNPSYNLSFNLSSMSFESMDAFDNILSYLSLHKDILNRLIVEITETCMIKDLGKAAMFVAKLQDLGCRVAIDDFGSGYTSFRQIKALSVDYVKIDGAFIKDIESSSDNTILVSSVIEMCHKLGIKTIAEYVENANITKKLIDMGCGFMQGNYFSPASTNKPI